eukprot:TRINITY_DN3919_c0_g1_i4.p1 TRINITY_DN3919_c0_g1~~TRINITY_DN3919_c0_g1_i4.p1  ORF type:complete len:141 (-),score=32.23 TRINITY_DN3919_c0_g1_i4:120-542(-)
MAQELPRIRYITADFLAERIDSGESDFVVFDVRDGDFIGGNIAGAVNIPSGQFQAAAAELAQQYHDQEKYIIFHCMMSQQRGPRCASLFRSQLATVGQSKCKVCVLEGGFSNWILKWRGHPKFNQYVVNFLPSVWVDEQD